MPIAATLQTLDGLDEAFHSLYSKTEDGTFVLQVEGINQHPEIASLKGAYDRVKADRDTIRQDRDILKAKVDEFPEDFDGEKWAKLKDGKADEAATIKMRQTLEAERDQWKTKYEATEAAMRRSALDRDLTEALTAVGVNKPALLQGARAIHGEKVKIGEDGKPFVETDMGPLGLKDFVGRWAASEEGRDYVTPASGGGAQGSGSNPKPNAPKTWGEAKTPKEKAALLKQKLESAGG